MIYSPFEETIFPPLAFFQYSMELSWCCVLVLFFPSALIAMSQLIFTTHDEKKYVLSSGAETDVLQPYRD